MGPCCENATHIPLKIRHSATYGFDVDVHKWCGTSCCRACTSIFKPAILLILMQSALSHVSHENTLSVFPGTAPLTIKVTIYRFIDKFGRREIYGFICDTLYERAGD